MVHGYMAPLSSNEDLDIPQLNTWEGANIMLMTHPHLYDMAVDPSVWYQVSEPQTLWASNPRWADGYMPSRMDAADLSYL